MDIVWIFTKKSGIGQIKVSELNESDREKGSKNVCGDGVQNSSTTILVKYFKNLSF